MAETAERPEVFGIRTITPSNADISDQVAKATRELGRKLTGTVKPQDVGHQATIEVYTNGKPHVIGVEGAAHTLYNGWGNSMSLTVKVLAEQGAAEALKLPAVLDNLHYKQTTAVK